MRLFYIFHRPSLWGFWIIIFIFTLFFSAFLLRFTCLTLRIWKMSQGVCQPCAWIPSLSLKSSQCSQASVCATHWPVPLGKRQLQSLAPLQEEGCLLIAVALNFIALSCFQRVDFHILSSFFSCSWWEHWWAGNYSSLPRRGRPEQLWTAF